MSPVFSRRLPDPHPYDNALSDLSNFSAACKTLGFDRYNARALAFNFMYDHRISEEREASFNPYLSNPGNPDVLDFMVALKNYHENRIRTQRDPDYIKPSINANNLINEVSFSCLKLKKTQKLIRVIDLNGLREVFLEARDKNYGGGTFNDFPLLTLKVTGKNPATDAVMDWLNKKLEHSAANEVQDFIAKVLDAMNWFGSTRPYQPTWATLWSCFKGIEREPPNRWLEVVGVHKNFSTLPRWIILLKYTVKEAGIIARPTQLDAGNYPHHFPSPPQAPLPVGGHSMDLCQASTFTRLLPEVIHNQIDHSIEHWISAGRSCRKVSPSSPAPVGNQIKKQRQRHHKLLVKTYGKNVYTWMRSPM